MTMAYQEYGFGGMKSRSGRLLPRRIDWFKHSGNKLAGVYSHRNSDKVVYQIWLGRHSGSRVTIAMFPGNEDIKTLEGESVKRYEYLALTDSLWTLFSDFEFWNSDDGWEEVFHKYSRTRLGKLDYELSRDMSMGFMISPKNRTSDDNLRSAYSSDIGKALLLDFDRELSRYVDDQRAMTTLDLRTLIDDAFVVVISRRDEHRGAYVACVGQVHGRLITYRIVSGGPIPISGEALQNYVNLYASDSLVTLIGEMDRCQTKEGLLESYESCLLDSLPIDIQTHTLHLDSLFTKGKITE